MPCKIIIFALFVLAVITGCQHQKEDVMTLSMENAAYYWRTTWRIDSTEAAFLSEHDIRRVYCRYFDVVMRDGEPMPNATIRFPDNAGEGTVEEGNDANNIENDGLGLPTGIRLVPTVYITEDCMSHAPRGGWPGLAERLVDRIVQMNATHDLQADAEIQVDCDYTLRSRTTYYDFLEQVRSAAKAHGICLSTTIRLHQLSMPAPPADYGVLMVYNTGDPQNFAQRNPILDIRDVQPYMRYLNDYPLPLAAAYPVYRWQRDVDGVRIEHTVESSEILAAKKMVETARKDLSHTIIIYHLDKENINRYDNDTYRKIYRH